MKEILLNIRLGILIGGLVVVGIEDLRKKEIGSLPLLIMGGLGVLLSLLAGDWTDWTVILRFLPGIFTLFLAWLTKESIGYGDGLTILCLGCFLPGEQIAGLCMMAITVAGIVALFLLLVKHRGKKTQIPFVPFLLIGLVITELA